MIEFPKNFLWGAATSAHQVEGNNTNSDWWEWERDPGLVQPSGEACRHYELYKQDFDLAQGLGHNAHRLSLEWSRIEPQEGVFSDKELRHYRDVLIALKERGLQALVTLHHFTNPIWFSRIGGWENKKSADYFLRYVREVIEALGDKVSCWMTINEPLVYAYHAYLLGVWPPQKKSVFAARRVSLNFARSHIASYRLIHRLYKDKNWPAPKVSIAKNMQAFVACQDTLRNRLAVKIRDWGFNFDFLNRLAHSRSLDYIGVNYYSWNLVETLNWGVKSLCVDTCQKNHRPLKKNSLGWDIYPQGLYELLIKLKRYNLPLIISENGICTEDDALRWEYISGHLASVHRAMAEGAQVLGYLYWSLLDNYEWDKGFVPRFGLVEVDYNNYARSPRESARKFAQVCRTGRLDYGVY